jgi:hypothetical protein
VIDRVENRRCRNPRRRRASKFNVVEHSLSKTHYKLPRTKYRRESQINSILKSTSTPFTRAQNTTVASDPWDIAALGRLIQLEQLPHRKFSSKNKSEPVYRTEYYSITGALQSGGSARTREMRTLMPPTRCGAVMMVVALGACAPTMVKPGVSQAEANSDSFGCKMVARGAAPGGSYAE